MNSTKSRMWVALTAAATMALFAFVAQPAQASPCATCGTSAKVGGSTALTSRANVSLSGLGNAYSQSKGTGFARATATATPGTSSVASAVTSTAGTEGLVFSVGNGNYTSAASLTA